MRILIHDYGGYNFTVQLARQLAKRGHQVDYLYSDTTQLVKRGAFKRKSDDPGMFRVTGLCLSEPFQKYSWFKRRAQEIQYGRLLAHKIEAFRPEVVFSANTPLDAQALALKATHRCGSRFVFWLQDIIGLATSKILKQKSPLMSEIIGGYYIRLERKLLHQSQRIILLSEDFQPLMHRWGLESDRLAILPNWAPLDELPTLPRENLWSQAHGLQGGLCFLYSGVLGMKHSPNLLLQLAIYWKAIPRVKIVVVSQGPGADWLKAQVTQHHLDNLFVMDYQSHEIYPYVLASADVLLALLNDDAGIYSVPSKVFTYLCAERPLLVAIPSENLAARIVCQNEAGIVVEPGNVEAFIAAAEKLRSNITLRAWIARNARAYAEKTFDIQRITDQFEAVF